MKSIDLMLGFLAASPGLVRPTPFPASATPEYDDGWRAFWSGEERAPTHKASSRGLALWQAGWDEAEISFKRSFEAA